MGILRNLRSAYHPLESWFYDRYIATGIARLLNRALAEFEPYLRPLHSRSHVLDVGCGGGHLIMKLASEHEDFSFTGLDLSPGQLARARSRSGNLGARVRWVEGSATKLPFADDYFDLVVSVGSIKHWPDQARGLSECVRVLRPGGTIAIVEADRGCRDEDVRAFVKRWGVPGPMRLGARLFYRGFVSGLALDLEDARALVSSIPGVQWEVARLPGTPALVMRGRRT